MSFLEHLDELRRRLVNSVIFITLAFIACWFLSEPIYNFLSVPVRRALSNAQRVSVPVSGLTGEEKVVPLSNLVEGDRGRFIFDQSTKLGNTVIAPGSSVQVVTARDTDGSLRLFTDEPIYTTNAVISKGVRLPVLLTVDATQAASDDEKLVFTSAVEPFTLYLTVALYAAIALSVPFLLWQIWGFISPALYKHERAYVTPFIGLSTISFVLGAAFAYSILFPLICVSSSEVCREVCTGSPANCYGSLRSYRGRWCRCYSNPIGINCRPLPSTNKKVSYRTGIITSCSYCIRCTCCS